MRCIMKLALNVGKTIESITFALTSEKTNRVLEPTTIFEVQSSCANKCYPSY